MGTELRRDEAGFLVLIAALAGAAIAGAGIRVSSPGGEAAFTFGWPMVATLVTVGLAGAALWGVYRGIMQRSIRHPGLLLYVLAGMFVFGADDWLVQVPLIPLTIVMGSSATVVQVGVNVGGIILFWWYMRTRSRIPAGPAVEPRHAPGYAHERGEMVR